MTLKTAGLLSPGDMGHIVGNVLVSHGLRVITCLGGRSERTRALAKRAEIADVPTYQDLVREADIILSILVPAQGVNVATKVAGAIDKTGVDIVYADCNAVSPQTARRMDEIITNAGGRFVDASIIGPPPRNKGTTRFYASGPHVSDFEALSQFGLDVRPLGEEIGLASAIKMCYASSTKGFTALWTELLTVAEALGVSQALKAEFQLSQSTMYKGVEHVLPSMPPKSRRWIGEMEEIAATFAYAGLTPKIFLGAADMYRFVGETHLADLTPEDRDAFPSFTEMISTLAGYLEKREE